MNLRYLKNHFFYIRIHSFLSTLSCRNGVAIQIFGSLLYVCGVNMLSKVIVEKVDSLLKKNDTILL